MGNQVLGRGKLYAAPVDSVTLLPIGGERYFGNTPELGFNVEQEKLDHYSSEAGTKQKDKSVVLEVSRAGTFSCDEISKENVALFLMGASSTYSQALSAGQAETLTGVEQGFYYQLGMTSGNPGGVRNAVMTSVKDETDTTTYAAGTDYVYDQAKSRLYIVPGGAIASAAAEDFHLIYDVPAETRDAIISGDSEFACFLRFIADNPEGENKDWTMPYVKISPNGDFSLKGDDWQTMSFNIEVLKRDDTTEAIYVDGRAVA